MSFQKIENTEEVVTNIDTPIKTVNENETVEDRLTDNARNGILPARYFVKNEDGEIREDASGMFSRVAENVAEAEPKDADAEKWSDEFYKQMTELRFMPNSPTLMNAGTDMNQLSACFVLEPRDDMEDIFETAKDAALVFQSGGGVGYAFSHLRPKGAYIGSTGGEASGPVSFMRVFDETCNQVKQGGKRRGAQMGVLRVDHPDIGRFAVSKRREGEFENFNISVGYTDEFIDAVENDDEYTLFDPEEDYEDAYDAREASAKFYDPSYSTNPRNAQEGMKRDDNADIVEQNFWRDYADDIEGIEKHRDKIDIEKGEPLTLPAQFIFDIMVDGAYRNGEPGLFYLDETNREHSFDVDEYPKHEINATNPCAEQPLSEHEACNLGHINLSLILEDGSETFDEYIERTAGKSPHIVTHMIDGYLRDVIDFDNFDRTIEAGVRFLDDVVTRSDFPIDEIEKRVNEQRKIGLGVMGFAQMLYQMGIPYGSDKSYYVAKRIMQHIDRFGTDVSHNLAKERGSFDAWDESKYADPERYSEWFERHTGQPASDYPNGYPIRNHNITTVAPTGTTSMIGNTSGGIEPVFSVANYKNVDDDIQGDEFLVEFDDYFLETLRANDIDVDYIKEEAEGLMEENEFSIDELSIPDEIAEIFVTTQDLSPEQHGLMQRVFQEFVDSGISKTVNMPNEATRDDVKDAYLLALREDEIGDPIKGMTVYRDGSRNEQVLTTRVDNNLDDEDDDILELYLKGEISEKAGRQLGVVSKEDENSDTITCPECGEGEIEKTDDCAVCPVCWYSPCK